MGEFFECEIQARLRDINIGGHVDNVEAIRVLDEARLLFLRFARLTGDDDRPGLFRDVPPGIVELMASQRVDYHAEMRFVPFQPFLLRLWVSHIGRSSLALSSELRVAPDHAPALVAESTLVFWDSAQQSSWAMSDQVRETLASYSRAPVALRGRR